MVTDADSDAFDAMVGSWLMRSLLSEPAAQGLGDDSAELVPVRLDGKTVRDARESEGNKRHLLAALGRPHCPRVPPGGPIAAGGDEGATPPRWSQADQPAPRHLAAGSRPADPSGHRRPMRRAAASATSTGGPARARRSPGRSSTPVTNACTWRCTWQRMRAR